MWNRDIFLTPSPPGGGGGSGRQPYWRFGRLARDHSGRRELHNRISLSTECIRFLFAIENILIVINGPKLQFAVLHGLGLISWQFMDWGSYGDGVGPSHYDSMTARVRSAGEVDISPPRERTILSVKVVSNLGGVRLMPLVRASGLTVSLNTALCLIGPLEKDMLTWRVWEFLH